MIFRPPLPLPSPHYVKEVSIPSTSSERVAIYERVHTRSLGLRDKPSWKPWHKPNSRKPNRFPHRNDAVWKESLEIIKENETLIVNWVKNEKKKTR